MRRCLTVLDGVVAGEGEGPLAPDDRPLGVVIAGLDPVAVDLAAVRLMGFDEERLPKVREAMAGGTLPVTGVRSPSDVDVREIAAGGADVKHVSLDGLEATRTFRAHSGWRGHVERVPCAA